MTAGKKRKYAKPGIQATMIEPELQGKIKIKASQEGKDRVYKNLLFSSSCPACGEPVQLTRQVSDHGMSINHKAECPHCHAPLNWEELENVELVRTQKKPMASHYENVPVPTLIITDNYLSEFSLKDKYKQEFINSK